MRNRKDTQARILNAAKALFWTRGYSSVAMRDIASQAKTDVALVARYFGSKKRLFLATLDGALIWPGISGKTGEDVLHHMIQRLAKDGREGQDITAIRMLLVNISDPEVGAEVRARYLAGLYEPMQSAFARRYDDTAIALLAATLVGLSLGRSLLQIPELTELTPDLYAQLLRDTAQTTLHYRSP
jgi:AcrR family transcriptional regulator